jgi:DNA-binding NarL/FixJ family response regulator
MSRGSESWRWIVEGYAEAKALSGQERRLLELAVSGAHNKLIADELGLSLGTVATYWRRIFAKTGKSPQRSVLADVVQFAASRVASGPWREN